jgi:hypothetical protein
VKVFVEILYVGIECFTISSHAPDRHVRVPALLSREQRVLSSLSCIYPLSGYESARRSLPALEKYGIREQRISP